MICKDCAGSTDNWKARKQAIMENRRVKIRNKGRKSKHGIFNPFYQHKIHGRRGFTPDPPSRPNFFGGAGRFKNRKIVKILRK